MSVKKALHDTMHESDHTILRLNAVRLSISVAFILVGIKLYAYLASDSVSVLSSLIDSSVDFMTSSFLFFGIKQAIKPADRSHRYGHYKVESLLALGQAAFIIGSCLILLYETIGRFSRVDPVTPQSHMAIGIMLLSILLTVILLLVQRFIIRKTGSIAIKADLLHYKGDLLMTIAVIAALYLSHLTQNPLIDPAFALGIILYLIWGTAPILKTSFDVLMDRELPKDKRIEIRQLILKQPYTRGMHDLRTRFDGVKSYIEFHLELDPDLTLAKAHDHTDHIEKLLLKAFDPAEIIIHQEPAGLDDERLDHKIKKVVKVTETKTTKKARK